MGPFKRLAAQMKLLAYDDLRQFDDLVHALDAVIDRDLNERVFFLDPESRRFRGFVGRIRGFRLPIHLEAKSAAVRLLALRDPLRNGLLRRRGHGYGLGLFSRWRHHLMISLCCRFLVVAVTDVSCCGFGRTSGNRMAADW